jgi:hypothetical protein
MIPALLGKAIGGRTGAIVGAGLGGGVMPALVASQVIKKPKNQQTNPAGTTFG